MVSLFLLLGCNLSYIVDLFAALHELASARARTLLKLGSSVRALLKPYGDALIPTCVRSATDVNRLTFTFARRPLLTWRLGRVIFLREVRLFKMAVFARIFLVLAICPAVRAQGRAGSFVITLE